MSSNSDTSPSKLTLSKMKIEVKETIEVLLESVALCNRDSLIYSACPTIKDNLSWLLKKLQGLEAEILNELKD